jgi:hypothetical protein
MTPELLTASAALAVVVTKVTGPVLFATVILPGLKVEDADTVVDPVVGDVWRIETDEPPPVGSTVRV